MKKKTDITKFSVQFFSEKYQHQKIQKEDRHVRKTIFPRTKFMKLGTSKNPHL